MHITSLGKVPKNEVQMEGAAGVYKQLLLGSAQGAPNFSFRVFSLEPQGHTPYHEHESEHLNYIISGDGVLIDQKGYEHPLKTGDFALVLPGEKHQYRNKSAEASFVMI